MRETFHWTETAARLRSLLEQGEAVREGRSLVFTACGEEIRFTPPPVQGMVAQMLDARTYLETLRSGLGSQMVLLLQAGAAALGVFSGEDCLAHKVIKKYVVRGHGRAQPTHLRTAGKSRYGSRLRLRNARALLIEVNERLCDWSERHGPFDRIFYSAPVRTWPELFRTRPAPPFAKSEGIKIPRDTRVPCYEELLATRRFLLWGSVTTERPGEHGRKDR